MNPIDSLIKEVETLRTKLKETSLDFVPTNDLITELQNRTKTSIMIFTRIEHDNHTFTYMFHEGSLGEVMGLVNYADLRIKTRLIKDFSTE